MNFSTGSRFFLIVFFCVSASGLFFPLMSEISVKTVSTIQSIMEKYHFLCFHPTLHFASSYYVNSRNLI